MENPTKTAMGWMIALLLTVEASSASSVTATDGGTAAYGACNGFAIDFDATVAPSAVWSPALVNGQNYTLSSVTVKNATGNSGNYYLGVYTGYSGGTLSGFQGVSDAVNDFSTSPNGWLTFTFSNLNCNLTVDSAVGSGTGLLYFVYQSGTSAVGSPGVTLATDKFGADTSMTDSLASIIAYGGLVANRSPQYQATIISTEPPQPPAAPTGLSAVASNNTVSLTWAALDGATSYNVKRSPTGGSGYTTITNVAGTNVIDGGLDYNATYYYVVSALNSQGEGDDSGEVSATTAGLPGAVAVTNHVGVTVAVGSNGIYQVNFTTPKWVFMGDLAQTLTGQSINTGTDNIGDYSEITFGYTSAVPHAAGIRLYSNSPVVTFNDVTLAEGSNDLALPKWKKYPVTQSHLSFGNIFTTYNFSTLFSDSLWLFFNTNHDAFIITAATNYMVASTVRLGDNSISCGINSAIPLLPSGFSHRVILTAENGINQIYSTWGNALLALSGKNPPANDATVELDKFGYWTDNGAAYYPYYNGTSPGITNTLLAVKNEFAGKGVPISYMQMDSWWYEKGPDAVWNDPNNGFYLYVADPTLFGSGGLAGFQQQLDLPLILHNRWAYYDSPYITVSNYTASGLGTHQGVIIDPLFWTNIMGLVTNYGAITYEQDWLGYQGIPAMNLTDPPAYLNNMAWAAAANGVNLQYCMVEGRDYLQGTLYTNLMTIRTSEDRFDTTRWGEDLYGSRLAQAMGIWPWTDVYMSTETRNLLISTLSAGPVGTGDALGTVNATNLLKSVRSDGVIVKPDVPLVPVDDAYVNDALGQGRPMVATTYTDHTNSRALYVYAYAENAAKLTSSFKPADFGIGGSAYVYDFFAATGMVVNAGGTFNFTTTMSNVFDGGSYFIAVPVGASGVALVGDSGKFVTRGKKRISQLTDNGTLTTTVKFAPGEPAVTLLAYSPTYPSVSVSQGAGGLVAYDPVTGLFTANVTPDGTSTAVVQLAANGSPPPAPAAPAGLTATAISSNQVNLSWLASSGASSYNIKRSVISGGPYAIVANGFQTNYSDSGLPSGVVFHYVVSAVNGGGESVNSPEAAATTSNTPSQTPTIFEAENATMSGPTIASQYSGYSGTGYADYNNATGDYVEWTVNATSSGAYPLTWRYANGGAGDRPLRLSVNGIVVTTNNFPATGGWATWQFAATNNVTLNAGNNTVRFTAIGSSGGNVDYLLVTVGGTQPPNTSPVLAPVPDRTMNAGMTLNVTNVATDTNVPAQTLTYGLLSAPANAVLYASSGVLTWRPLVTQANTTNLFTITVTDSGTPSLSATQSFTVTVNPLQKPQFSTPALSGGQLVLQVNGDNGPDYQIQTSTNLINWSAIFTTNSPAMPFVWTSGTTNGSMSFFRILAGPPVQ